MKINKQNKNRKINNLTLGNSSKYKVNNQDKIQQELIFELYN